MKSKRFLVFSLILSLLTLSCEKSIDDTTESTSSAEDGVSHESSDDYTWDASTELLITLEQTTITTTSADVLISGSTATIQKGGNYRVQGTLSNGELIVDAKDETIRLILDGAAITNSGGPAILVENSAKTVVCLSSGSSNQLTDGATYTNTSDDPNAALYSKSDLSIFGEGNLIVKGNYQDGISSKDGLILNSGNIQVTASDDGIRGKDFIIEENANVIVNSGGDAIKSDNEGGSNVGYILISGGRIKAVAGGDGITAQTEVTATAGSISLVTGGGSSATVGANASAKGIKGLTKVSLTLDSCTVSSADDAIHSNKEVIFNSGVYSLSTNDDGVHADASISFNDGNLTILKAYEGFESHVITVNAGNINITSSDDSFNATAGSRTEQNDNSYEYIYGGHLVLNSSAGDPLDSNGSIAMTAGTVIIHGPASQPEVGIDYNGSFNLSGGFIIASGPSSNMTQAPSSGSSQNAVKLLLKSSVAANTLFHVEDADGNEIFCFSPYRKYQSMVFSSPLLLTGSTYKVYKTGTNSGTNDNGLYTGGSYTPGTLAGTFTISQRITSISNF